MNNSTIQFITQHGRENQSSVTVQAGAGKQGKALRLSAAKGAVYELRDLQTQVAPDQVLLMRKGNDLHILLGVEGIISEKDQPADIIVEGYYDGNESKLVGLAEDGRYYTYLPQEAQAELLSWNLADGVNSYHSLGDTEYVVAAWWPTVLGAGVLAALGVLLEVGTAESLLLTHLRSR